MQWRRDNALRSYLGLLPKSLNVFFFSVGYLFLGVSIITLLVFWVELFAET